MRYLCGFMCVLALGVMGCSETAGTGGSGGDGGTGGMPECQSPEDCDDNEGCTEDECTDGVCQYTPLEDETECFVQFPVGGGEPGFCEAATCVPQCEVLEEGDACTRGDQTGLCLGGSCEPPCEGSVCPCTEGGIRAAIAEGGGPFTFDCGDEPETVTTRATIVIDNDVILDGGGNLTLDGDDDHAVLVAGTRDLGTVELRGFRITGGPDSFVMGPGYAVYVCCEAATVILKDSTVSDNGGDGILNQLSTLLLLNTTVSGNGLTNLVNIDDGTLTVTNSTISGGEVGISNWGQMTISSSTVVSENLALRTTPPGDGPGPTVALANTIVAGGCEGDVVTNVTSNGYNIESVGDTCGFDQPTDQVDVSADDLKLGPLQDNGGPTETLALGAGSVAIDVIPAVDCGVDEDQRGEPRPETGGTMCDVGAFEVQP